MKKIGTPFLALSLLLVASVASAAPVAGTYTTTDLGGQLLTGRASTWRPTVNSGFPKVLHAQSWNGGTLGTQWELRCAVENVGIPPNTSGYNPGTGTGVIIYTQNFTGGQFELYNTGGPWGDGVANLNTTTVVSTVQFVNFQPVASVVNANTSGDFGGGCTLTFAISNGVGVCETPFCTIPADYPAFLDGSCAPASPALQFGTWGNTLTSTMRIDCVVPATPSTWGSVKSLYRL